MLGDHRGLRACDQQLGPTAYRLMHCCDQASRRTLARHHDHKVEGPDPAR